jgi:hypothetical protein
MTTKFLFFFPSREFYSIEELREKPPPKGVDPTKLEKYLSEEDFMVRENIFIFIITSNFCGFVWLQDFLASI